MANLGKADRLGKSGKRVRGWRGQKYVRKTTAKTRRRLEKEMLRSKEYEKGVPNIPAKGYAD